MVTLSINALLPVYCLSFVFTFFPIANAQEATSSTNTYTFVSGDICDETRCTCHNSDYDCTGDNLAKLITASSNFSYYVTFGLEPTEFDSSDTLLEFYITYVGATANSEGYSASELVTSETLATLDSSVQKAQISPSSGQVSLSAQYADDAKTEILGNYGSTLLTAAFEYNDTFGSDYTYSVFNVEIERCDNDATCEPVYPSELFLVVQKDGSSVSGSGGNTGNASKDGNGEDGNNTGTIVGIIVGVVAVVLVAGVAGVYYYRRQSSGKVGYAGGAAGGGNGSDATGGDVPLVEKQQDYEAPQVEVNDKDEELYKQNQEETKVY